MSPTPGASVVKDRGEAPNRSCVASDHQAIAARNTPDSSAGADVHVDDAFLSQSFGTPHVIFEVGVAAVDHYIARFHQIAQAHDRGLCRTTGWQHHPGGAGMLQFCDDIFERGGGNGTLSRDIIHFHCVEVEDHALVSAGHQTPHHIGAHSS